MTVRGVTRRNLLRRLGATGVLAGGSGVRAAGGVRAESDPPTAEFTYSPKPPRPGQKVTFDGSESHDNDGSDKITSYQWYLDKQPIATGSTFTHTFSEVGNYSVSLTVTDDENDQDSAVVSVSVENAPPIPEFTWSPEFPAPDETVTFDASKSYDPNGTIRDYNWYVEGSLVEEGKTADFAFNSEGDYEVTLGVVDDSGASAQTSNTVHVGNEPPNPKLDYNPSDPKPGETVYFNATGSTDPDGTVATYRWYIEGSLVQIGRSYMSHTFDERGEYEIKVTAIDDDGMAASTTMTLVIGNDPPDPTFEYQPKSPVVGEPVTFDGSDSSDPDGTVVQYEWYLDGVRFGGSSATVTHTFDDPGERDVTLTVTDDDGATASTTRSVVVGERTPTPTQTPTASPTASPTATATTTRTQSATATTTGRQGNDTNGGDKSDPASDGGDGDSNGESGMLLPALAGAGLLGVGGAAALLYRWRGGPGSSDVDIDEILRRADESYNEAEAAVDEGEFGEAITHYDAAIEDYEWVLDELDADDERRVDVEAALDGTRERRREVYERREQDEPDQGPTDTSTGPTDTHDGADESEPPDRDDQQEGPEEDGQRDSDE